MESAATRATLGKEDHNLWMAVAITLVLSTLALPTCTGFFLSLYLFQGILYFPIGLVAFGFLVASFVLLERTKHSHESLGGGLQDSIKLNIFLGILAWTFYYMPSFAPAVGRFFGASYVILGAL